MNIQIKRIIVAASAVATVATPMLAVASDGTITFTGAVTSNSCTIDVNGGGPSATVALPIVDTASLDHSTSVQEQAGGTFFYITLSACSSIADVGLTPTSVQVYFEAGPNVNQGTGGLINGGTSNVEVNLYNASNSSVVGTQITPGSSSVQPAVQAIGSAGQQWFYAAYSTAGADAAATAGTVSTSVTYSLVYL